MRVKLNGASGSGSLAGIVSAFALATALFVPASGALAQAVPPAAVPGIVQENERIQREQESRRLQQLQRDRESARPPARIEVPTPEVNVAGDPSVCRDIAVISIDGVTRLGGVTLRKLKAPYVGKCLSVTDVERLLGDVTKAYIDRGYATARAYLPAQDLSGGTLRVTVVEGRISDLKLEGRGVNLYGAFLNPRGDILNLRRLEQGIDQINRLSSNNATLDIRPGAEPGDSIVVVSNQPRRRIYANLSADNLGSRSTGRNQTAVTLSTEALLGLNELISVTRRQSEPLNDGPNRSSSESYFASVPLGPLSFSGGYTQSRYRTRISTVSGIPLTLTGDSKNLFGTVDAAVYRSRTEQLHLTATLTTKDNESFVDGQRLDVSSRKLTVLDLDANYSVSAPFGLFTFGVGYSRGLKAFDALEDLPDLPGEVPTAQFVKWRFSAAYFNSFTIVGKQRLSVSSILAAQTTPDTLYGSEQFAVGGVFTVRGFREASIINDKGFSWRNEIGLPIEVARPGGIPLGIKPYVGVDVGRVSGNAPGTPSGTLSGGAVGTSITYGPVFFDLFVADRFAAPAILQREGVQLFGRFSIRI